MSVPLDTLVATVQATDIDSSAEQITYHITNLTFAHLSNNQEEIKSWPFFLDQLTGQIRTTSSMVSYSEGHFNIVVAAVNSDISGRHSNTTIKVGQILNIVNLNSITFFLHPHNVLYFLRFSSSKTVDY